MSGQVIKVCSGKTALYALVEILSSECRRSESIRSAKIRSANGIDAIISRPDKYKTASKIQAWIAQLVANRLGNWEVWDSNPGKGDNFSMKIEIDFRPAVVAEWSKELSNVHTSSILRSQV